MKNPLKFYSKRLKKLEEKAADLKKKSVNLSIFRFAVFLGTCFLVYLTFGTYPDVFIIAFLGVVLFAFLVVKHLDLKRKRNIVSKKIDINTTEIKVLHREFYHC